jgi:hypothetical protein
LIAKLFLKINYEPERLSMSDSEEEASQNFMGRLMASSTETRDLQRRRFFNTLRGLFTPVKRLPARPENVLPVNRHDDQQHDDQQDDQLQDRQHDEQQQDERRGSGVREVRFGRQYSPIPVWG